MLDYRSPDLAPEPDPDEKTEPGVLKISGKWIILMVLLWPAVIYLIFFLLTR